MIYLDSAATSLWKPPQVGSAVHRAIRQLASPGRGTHRPAMLAADTALFCREAAAKLFHVPEPEQVVFTLNATHGLNLAIRSLVKLGDRVVISGYEHNAVVRPLYALGADVDVISTPLFDPEEALHIFSRRIPGAKAVVCTHISNVFGYVLPIAEIAELCRRHSVPLIVDAAQSAGVLDIDFANLGAAFIAMPGHKGLMGPQGTGLLLCRDGGEPLLFGGTGSMSSSTEMPDFLPDRLEAGTQNICGIAGLLEGIRFIQKNTTEKIRQKEARLLQQMIQEFKKILELDVICDDGQFQSGVVSVIPKTLTCEALAEELGRWEVAVRSGLHCAPLAHQTAGTSSTGTVRFSLSPFNTQEEIMRTASIIKKILKFGYKM